MCRKELGYQDLTSDNINISSRSMEIKTRFTFSNHGINATRIARPTSGSDEARSMVPRWQTMIPLLQYVYLGKNHSPWSAYWKDCRWVRTEQSRPLPASIPRIAARQIWGSKNAPLQLIWSCVLKRVASVMRKHASILHRCYHYAFVLLPYTHSWRSRAMPTIRYHVGTVTSD